MHTFPENLISTEDKVIVACYGNVGKEFADFMLCNGYTLCGIIDNFKAGEHAGDLSVETVSAVQSKDYDKILICLESLSQSECVKSGLLELGVPAWKIISYAFFFADEQIRLFRNVYDRANLRVITSPLNTRLTRLDILEYYNLYPKLLDWRVFFVYARGFYGVKRL